MRVGPAARRTSIVLSWGQWGREPGVHVVASIGRWRRVGGAGRRQRGRQKAEIATAVATPQLPHLLPARAHQVLVLGYPHLLAVHYACPFWSWSVPGSETVNILVLYFNSTKIGF